MSEQAGSYKTKPKVPLPSTLKKAAVSSEDRLLSLARRWADLHSKPKQRDKMDEILVGLSEAEARRVILCGQRIASGLTPKIAPR
jgi:hypothetical protein